MDNNDEMKNGMDNKSGPKSKSPKEEIPLWLQGLEDDELEDTKPIVSSEDVNDSWVPEIPDIQTEKVEEPEHLEPVEKIMETGPETSESPQVDQIIDDDSFLESQEDSAHQEDEEGQASREVTPQDEMTPASDDQDISEEIEMDAFPEVEINQNMVLPVDEGPTSEGFVDISDLDLTETPEQEEVEIDEDSLRDGELPEWLQEMITESDEVVAVEAEPVALEEPETAAEPEENILETILPEEGVFEELDIEELDIEEPDIEELDIEELDIEELDIEEELKAVPQPEPEPDFEAADFWIAEEDTSPVLISTDAPEEPTITDEIQEEERVQPLEDEESLDLVKQHIDQGDFNQALPLINNLVEQSSHLDSIKAWMVEAAEGHDAPKSAIWEVMGDIALKQNQPDVALDAYANAIRNLLQDDRGDDEIG